MSEKTHALKSKDPMPSGLVDARSVCGRAGYFDSMDRLLVDGSRLTVLHQIGQPPTTCKTCLARCKFQDWSV